MTKKFKIATLALSACMALGVVGFTACGQAGKSAYDIWLEQGNTGTEQDFLDSLKGAAGTPGTPGNPGTPGVEGKSAYQVWLELGNTGTEQDFLDSLKGDPGAAGARGNKITKGEGAPSAAGAIEGDMYVDTTNWHVYFFENGAWNGYGSIKGEGSSGDEDGGGEDSPQYKLVKDFGQKTIGTAESVPLELNDVDNGTYFLIVESDGEAVANNLTTVFTVSDLGTNNYDMYCPLTKGYKSVVKKEDSMKLSLKATTQSVTGNVKLVEYSAPTLNVGKTYEIPLIADVYGRLPLSFDSALIGHKVHFEVKFYKNVFAITLGHFNSTQNWKQDIDMVMATGDKEYVANTEMTITSEMSAITISNIYAGEHCNATVKLTIAD